MPFCKLLMEKEPDLIIRLHPRAITVVRLELNKTHTNLPPTAPPRQP